LRNRYLVAYDIPDQKRLRSVHRKLLGYGEPIQYSVFICDLSQTELITMKSQLLQLINANQDSIVIIDLGPVKGRGANSIDYMGKTFEIPERKPSII